jgi:hypothetical protein
MTSAAIAFHQTVEQFPAHAPAIDFLEHGIVSFARGGAWRSPPVFYRITSGHCDNRIDTQRRRLGADRP